jgi:antitoxin component of MazEF toxin-antitoxin module
MAMTVTTKKLGGSVAVLIPKAIAREMGLTEGTALEISATADTIVMRRRGRRPRRKLEEVVRQIRPAAYRQQTKELGDSGPVGKEIW